MTRVRVLRLAEEELRAAAEYYEAQRLGLGRAFMQEVRRAQHRIMERPLASRIERGDVRVRAIGRFPYRIFYRARDDEILIIAIAHRRRRPGFWRARV
jgi:plasmid stabilization system protein ParE